MVELRGYGFALILRCDRIYRLCFGHGGRRQSGSERCNLRLEAIGREIFARIAGAKPTLFTRSTLTGQLLEWSMQKEALKMQLFRLVDVLPALDSNQEVARHVGRISWRQFRRTCRPQ